MTDAEILDAVVADAQATQSIHREMIQRMVDWESREHGILNSDNDLRNAFVANLEGLRSAFVGRGLQAVGVPFPVMLDRANPAHAVILAVRDDIADTRDQLQAGKAQEVLGKRVSDAKIGMPEFVVRQATQVAADVADALKTGAQAGGDALGDFAKYLAWALAGGFGLYLLSQSMGGRK